MPATWRSSFSRTSCMHRWPAAITRRIDLDAYLQIAYALGSQRIDPHRVGHDRSRQARRRRRLAAPGDPADKPLVLLNSGAAFGASKLWPTEYFGHSARRIADQWGYPVLAICGPRTRNRPSDHGRRQPSDVTAWPIRASGDDYPLPSGLSKSLRPPRQALMVTTDSGPRHFAPAFDVPVITLFGPTPSRSARPISPKRSICSTTCLADLASSRFVRSHITSACAT